MQSSAKNTPFNVGERYEVTTYLGSGAYGHVVKAIDKLTKKPVAIKKLNKIEDIIDAKRILREIRVLRCLTHQNILELKNVIFTQTEDNDFGEIYLVTNLMEVDLHKLRQSLTDDHIQYIIYQILRGLKYLHSANIVHRDLKPSNILATSACETQICDFGFARHLDFSSEEHNNLTEYVVTRYYRAPEIMLSSQDYSKGVDIWSVGCIMAELMTGHVLFKGENYIQLINLMIDTLGKPKDMSFVTNANARKYLEKLPEKPKTPLSTKVKYENKLALDLLEKLLELDPKRRMTVEEALSHPYLAEYHDPKDEPIFTGALDFKFENDPKVILDDVLGYIVDEVNHFKRINKEKEIDKSKILKTRPKSASSASGVDKKNTAQNTSGNPGAGGNISSNVNDDKTTKTTTNTQLQDKLKGNKTQTKGGK